MKKVKYFQRKVEIFLKIYKGDIFFRKEKNFFLVNKKNIITYSTKNNCKNLISYFIKKNNNINRIGMVHRLDKDTTGIILISRNNLFSNNIKKLFKNRKIKKYYIVISKKNTKNLKIKKFIKIKFSNKKKYSITIVKNIFKINIKINKYNFSICKLITGRKNQIKNHFKSFFDSKKIILHSWKIKFKKNIFFSILNYKIINIIKKYNIKFKL